MGIFNPHVHLQNRNAGLGALDLILACRNFKMGLATIYNANDLEAFAAQNQKAEKTQKNSQNRFEPKARSRSLRRSRLEI